MVFPPVPLFRRSEVCSCEEQSLFSALMLKAGLGRTHAVRCGQTPMLIVMGGEVGMPAELSGGGDQGPAHEVELAPGKGLGQDPAE